MLISLVLAAIGGLLASGILFNHSRWLTYVAVAGAWAEGAWLVVSWLDRTILTGFPREIVFVVSLLVPLLVLLFWWRRWSLPQMGEGWAQREMSVVVILVLTLVAAWSIASVNGLQGTAWVSHGFYNGDTMTFATLVSQARETDGLPTNNLFAAGGSLEYPTVLHSAVATFLDAIRAPADWFSLWPVLTFGQIVLTIPLLFLLWDVLTPFPKDSWRRWLGIPGRSSLYWAQAGIVLFVLALSWDGYVYPQSHFFLTNLFLLVFALQHVSLGQRGKEQLPALVSLLPLAFVVSVSNAVTGTAVLALTAVWLLLRALDKRRSRVERIVWLVLIPALGWFFLQFVPGAGSLGVIPGFSYTATGDILRYTIPLLLIAAAALWHLKRHFFVVAGVAMLLLLTGVVFIFSSRDIVVANASRFIYHGVLIAAPLMLYPLARIWYWAKREVFYTSHSLPEALAVWVLSVGALGVALLPALQSVASAHDNLIRQDTQRVSVGELEALNWLKENTASDAVILASPEAPFGVPLFATRAMLRANYWLSPKDEVTRQTMQAFAGDPIAQGAVITRADYLYLRPGDTLAWSIEAEPVFRSSAAEIYALK